MTIPRHMLRLQIHLSEEEQQAILHACEKSQLTRQELGLRLLDKGGLPKLVSNHRRHLQNLQRRQRRKARR